MLRLNIKTSLLFVALCFILPSVQSEIAMPCVGGNCDLGMHSGNFIVSGGNPSLGYIAESFYQRIFRRLQHTFMNPSLTQQASNILSQARRNFQVCIDTYDSYYMNGMQQYKSCLGMHTQMAMEQIRYLEMMNRPYAQVNNYGNMPTSPFIPLPAQGQAQAQAQPTPPPAQNTEGEVVFA